MKLWVDDVRDPPDSTWRWVKTAEAAIFEMDGTLEVGNSRVTDLALDHDLGIDPETGEDLTTRPIVNWMIENDYWPERITVHSSNPPGRAWLEGTIERYRPERDDSRYHRQREESLAHPNRKDRLRPYHDTTRPYPEVAAQIEGGIAGFKNRKRE